MSQEAVDAHEAEVPKTTAASLGMPGGKLPLRREKVGTATRTLEDFDDGGGDGEGVGGGEGAAVDLDELAAPGRRGRGRKKTRTYGGGGGGGEEEGGAVGARAMERPCERLSEFVMPSTGPILPLDVATLQNPVIIIHAPRKSGCTTLIGSLLAALPGLNAAVVLTDRASTPGGYMHGVLPPQVVFERRKGPATLEAMIAMQRHHHDHFPGETLPKLALVMDDILYAGSSPLNNVDFKRNINIAAHFNISVIISTANVGLLPSDLATFATHVFATRCVDVKEPKQLLAKAFIMFEGKDTLKDALNLCRPHEFLVGVLRCHSSAVCSYQVPSTLPVFAMAASLVTKLSFALQDSK